MPAYMQASEQASRQSSRPGSQQTKRASLHAGQPAIKQARQPVNKASAPARKNGKQSVRCLPTRKQAHLCVAGHGMAAGRVGLAPQSHAAGGIAQKPRLPGGGDAHRAQAAAVKGDLRATRRASRPGIKRLGARPC